MVARNGVGVGHRASRRWRRRQGNVLAPEHLVPLRTNEINQGAYLTRKTWIYMCTQPNRAGFKKKSPQISNKNFITQLKLFVRVFRFFS